MAQQRMKLIRQADNSVQTTVEADINTLAGAPVALDANEIARIIIPDAIADGLPELLQAVKTAIADGQQFTLAEVA